MNKNETKKMSKAEFLEAFEHQKKIKSELSVHKTYWGNLERKKDTQKKYRW